MTQPTIALSPDGLSLLVTFPAKGRPNSDDHYVRAHTIRIPIILAHSFSCKHDVPGRRLGTREPCAECDQVKENRTVGALVNILKNRERIEREENRQAKLNEKGEPTQALIDAFFAAGNRIEDQAVRKEEAFKKKWGAELFDELSALAKEKEK